MASPLDEEVGGCGTPLLPSPAGIRALLNDYDGIPSSTVRRLRADPRGKRAVFAARSAACGYVVRVSVVPDAASWFLRSAIVLKVLEDRGHTAPVLTEMLNGLPILVADGMAAAVTTYIIGRRATHSSADLSAIGRSLRDLHDLAAAIERRADIPSSWWQPERVAAECKGLLDGVSSWLTPHERELHETLVTALAWKPSDDVQTIIHGDCRYDNAIMTDSGGILIDWDWTGLGLPVIDLARLLTNCFSDSASAPDVRRRRNRISAVLNGYRTRHASHEKGAADLAGALRFVAAANGTRYFLAGVAGSRNQQGISRLRAQLAASNEIASISRDC